VGSPIACEGSRTGFYTDDFEEQTFKSPEEIRKANLCNADLRGAKLDGVDFYLWTYGAPASTASRNCTCDDAARSLPSVQAASWFGRRHEGERG
jgi:hypothetical protein